VIFLQLFQLYISGSQLREPSFHSFSRRDYWKLKMPLGDPQSYLFLKFYSKFIS